MPLASVVIPAYNEAAVIDRCLTAIVDRDLLVVVAANGCTDDTVTRATKHDVQVIEVDAASKTAALDAGDTACGDVFPRIYLDADVVLTAVDARKLALELRGIAAPAVAAPRIDLDTSRSTRLVRSFYRAYTRLPYITDGLVGSGCYGVNAAGRKRWQAFPRITADDLFVQGLFQPAERHVVPSITFRVSAPRTLSSLLAVRTRIYFGNAEAASRGLSGSMTHSRSGSLKQLARLPLRDPARVADVLVYALINVTAVGRARRRSSLDSWLVDTSSRITA